MNYKSIAVTVLLVGVGSLQMIGDLAGWSTLKGIGAASQSAVNFAFCTHRGLLRELPLPTPLPTQFVVRIEPNNRAIIDPKWQLVYPIVCDAQMTNVGGV